MARILEMHKKWMKKPSYRKAFEALREEFVIAPALDAGSRTLLHDAHVQQRHGPVTSGQPCKRPPPG